MVSTLSTLLLVASAVTSVAAHASPAPVHWKRDNLEARESLQKRCGDILAARRRKRALHVSESLWSRGSYYMPRYFLVTPRFGGPTNNDLVGQLRVMTVPVS